MNNEIQKSGNFNYNKKLNIIENQSLTQNFDIKIYLDNIERETQLGNICYKSNNKIKFPSLKNNFSTINNNNNNKSFNFTTIKRRIARNMFNKNENKKYSSTNNLLSNSNSLKLTNSNKNKNKKLLIRNDESIKSSNCILNNKNIFITIDNNFNSKTYRQYKDKDKANSSNNIAFNRFNKKNYKNYNTFNNKEILYLKKYRNVLLDPINILKKYKMKNNFSLIQKENSINNFLNSNKEISKKNMLLKLIYSESQNIINKEKMNSNYLSNKKKKISLNELNFDEYKRDQKKACRQLEKYLFNIQKENRSLIEQEYNINYEMKVTKEYFKKYLKKINIYRIYGLFINEGMEGDTSRFEKKIFPIISDKELDFDYELLTKDTIENYKCFLNENNEFENDEKFIKEKQFIFEPKKVIERFIELQNRIIMLIEDKKTLEEDIKEIKKENESNLNYLKQRYDMLKNEYISLNENYQKEKIKYNNDIKKVNKKENVLYYLIKDLYNYTKIVLMRIKNINKNNNNNNKIISILDYFKNINNIILETQNLVNELIINLNNYEQEDKITFKKIVLERKDEIKIYKQNLAVQRIINRSIQMRKKAEINKNKLIFINRKTEQPLQQIKKIKKDNIVDDNKIKNLENEQLIDFDI